MDYKEPQPIYVHRYKARNGVAEMHIKIKTTYPSWDSSSNMHQADVIMQAVQNEAAITGHFEDPAHQPIILN